MTRSYLNCFVETKSEKNHQFCNKVFCGWDFSIAADNAALIRREIFHREIKELLEEQNFKEVTSSKFMNILKITFIRIIINILIILLIYAIGLQTNNLLKYTNHHYENLGSNNHTDQSQTWIFGQLMHIGDSGNNGSSSLTFPLFVTGVFLLTNKIFSLSIKYERYSGPRKPLYINLIRMFIVELVIISVFVKFWINLRPKTSLCWETYFSQEVYQILVIDFICSTIAILVRAIIFNTIYKWLNTIINCNNWNRGRFECNPAEFSIADNTFTLIHGQILFWIVFYFSPIISVLLTAIMFVTFYIKMYSLMYVYGPLSKSWRAEQTHTVFLVLTFLSLLLIISVHGYIMLNVHPSECCGPFRNADYAYQIVFDDSNTTYSSLLWNIVLFLKKPGVVFGMLLFLCVNGYLIRAKSLSEIKLVDTLRSLVVLQGKDKRFLTELLCQITNKPITNEDLQTMPSRQNRDLVQTPSLKNRNENASSSSEQLPIQKPSSSSKSEDFLTVPTNMLVQGLRGIPGSPRTARFDSEFKRGDRELTPTSWWKHKTGLLAHDLKNE